MSVVVLTRDLMDASRFRGASPDVVVARDIDAEGIAEAAVIVVDLALGLDLDAVVALGPPVIAYGAHVDADALADALARGCVDAVPRSRIFRRVGDLGS